MVWAIIAIWAIIIPLVVLVIGWDLTKRRDAQAVAAARHWHRSLGPTGVPRCAARAVRPRRTVTRRVCPELARTRRRPASA